jgi:uncharacterized protein YjiS (DUF1127 family)
MLIWQQMIRHWADWRMQQRQLQEFRSFLANDHRAAADIGITSCEAQRLLSGSLWGATIRHCEPTGPARSGRPDDALREAIQKPAA